jgi:1-acyl-sn-glycerol-3-phosphate acyltransferase
VGDVPGVRRGCVAVFGSPDPMTGTERLVVAAEVRRPGDALRRHITAAVQALWDVAPDVVLLLPPHTVPKTSSGKVRRSEARVRFERGELARPRPPWRQALELAAAALPGLRREAAERLYAGYAWTCFGLLAVVVWPAVALLPRRAWRAGLARASGWLLLRLLGVPLHVEGRPPAAGPCVYTCNHASYLDALVLVAALPPGVRYVAKRSFKRHFFSRVFMERLGVLFVERDDPRQGTADVRPLATALQAGDPLLIFPEGGIDRAPGLRPFHMGAFALAAEAGVPVVPLAIWGTRALLRSESWFPRRGPVRLSIGEPISPAGDGWESAVRLRDITFARILDHAGEPASHP